MCRYVCINQKGKDCMKTTECTKIVVLSFLLLTTSAFASEFYIATNGNDTNPGTKAKPFLTLEGARNAIRKDSGTSGVTVWIMGGKYQRTQPFELTGEDSGSASKPVIYRAFENEPVHITGAKELAISNFSPVKDPAILGLLSPDIRDKVVQFDLFGHGIKNLGKINPMGLYTPILPTEPELFFNDKPMTLARWPNSGWAKTGAIKTEGPAPLPPSESKSTPAASVVKIAFLEKNPLQWSYSKDIWLFGFWAWDWCDSTLKVGQIDHAQKHFIIEEQPAFGVEADRRYYAFNLLEELDFPGEYYIDRQSGILYFYPPDNLAGNTAVISLLESPLVFINGAHDITFQGLIFECTRGTAIHILGGSNNVVAGCKIRNCGNAAVNIGCGTDNETVGNYMNACYADSIWDRKAGITNGVISCDIYNMGEGGIILGGGNRKTLAPGGNFVKNNLIYNFNRRTKTCRPAVSVDGVGNIVANNVIRDAPHNGIVFYGNDHLIEYNELYNLCMETGDVGAIYTGRDVTARGSVVRFNFIHDTAGPVGKNSAQAIYLDDMASGIEIYGNVIYKVQTGMLIGGGLDNVIENNLIVDCGNSIMLDDRGTTAPWFKPHLTPPDGVILKRLDAVPYKQATWRSKYPKLAAVLDGNEPFAPKGNIVRNNVTVGSEPVDIAIVESAKRYGRVFDNLNLKDDPNADDAYRNKVDFYLGNNSAIFKLLPGFKQILTQKIGIQRDGYRN
jgi:hypothetical protein